MAQSKITLIGIENYLNPDRSVFDKLTLPDGIDKETLIGSIILRCQEFELLYSDPEFLIDAVNIWSRKNYWTFNRWVRAINVEYNPLYNFDRTEEITDNHTGSNNKTINGTNNETSDYTRTDNLTQTDDHTRTDNLSQSDDHTRTDNLTETMTHSEKAYNSDSTMVDTTKDVDGKTGTQRMAGTSNNTGTQRTAGTTTDTGTQRNAGSTNGSFNSGETGTDTANDTRHARMYGNIGVTTSQRMLESELDIAKWNMYEHIADLFCQEFCIMVY